jgi:hypothetical protein
MYHPLVEDTKNIKDNDLENRISDLNRKYYIAARSGQGGLCGQILTILDMLKEEQQSRYKKNLEGLNKKNQDLDDLINVK